MSLFALFVIALALSIDVALAGMTLGAREPKHKGAFALKLGVVFGVSGAFLAGLGYWAGLISSTWFADFDHWIAFLVLSGVGAHIIYNACQGHEDAHAPTTLWVTALATNVDAAVVGASLSFMDASLWSIALIGLCSAFAGASGAYFGATLGTLLGKKTEIAGGVVLIGIGALILWSHLG